MNRKEERKGKEAKMIKSGRERREDEKGEKEKEGGEKGGRAKERGED